MIAAGSAAFSARQLRGLSDLVEESETNGIPVIGLIVQQKPGTLDVALVGTYGDTVGRTSLGLDLDDPARSLT